LTAGVSLDSGVISHWDEIEPVRRERGHIAASWRSLTGDRSVGVGVQRIQIDPERWATPLHLENSEEEIFYVLSGSGVSLQWDGEATEAFSVEEGDCLVHLASEYAHTLRAGAEGLDVLAFGGRGFRGGSGRGRESEIQRITRGSARPRRVHPRCPGCPLAPRES
jgi:mannose-6-phosphate isomerase-like protein (cupin superfamily)